MRIYISIPISGHDPEEQRVKAERFAKDIDAIGHIPVNPFDISEPPKHFNEKQRYAYFMGFDIADLLMSDAAYFSRGWEQSKGCLLEHAAAEIYGLKIFYELDKIPEAE
jgi:hypothetical protein